MPEDGKVYTKDMQEWLQFMVKSGLVEQMKEHLSELERKREIMGRGMNDFQDKIIEHSTKIIEMEKKLNELYVEAPLMSNLDIRIEKLEKWNQNHLKFEHSAIADELLKHEKEISEIKEQILADDYNKGYDFTIEIQELKESHELSKDYNTIKRGKIKEVLRELISILIVDINRGYLNKERKEDLEKQLDKLDQKDGEKPSCKKCGTLMEVDIKSLNEIDHYCPECCKKDPMSPLYEKGPTDSKPSDLIRICWQCKNTVYPDNLGLYDIRCGLDGKIRDENYGCDEFEYDPLINNFIFALEKLDQKDGEKSVYEGSGTLGVNKESSPTDSKPSTKYLNPQLQCDGECYNCDDNIPSHGNVPHQCGRQPLKEKEPTELGKKEDADE